MEAQRDEIVYILINQAMPGFIKIGRTGNLEQRIRSLDTTSIPLPFECFFAARVQNATFVENKLHDAFGDHRIRASREFFKLSPERAVAALQLALIEDVTPKKDFVESDEDAHALAQARETRSAFNFEMVNIKYGSVLTFSRDPAITCIVLDNKNVEFRGERTSLSVAALKALNEMGYQWKSVQGPQYWEYEGETLVERRQRMEEA